MTPPADRQDRLAALYDAFNARDVEAVVAQFAPDVDWPDAWRGGRVIGRDAVRAYWLAQWAVIEPEVHPRRVRDLADGRVEVLVEQRVRDADGDQLAHAFVLHTYTFDGPLVSRMDVGDPQA
jgi:ketosteroid isomerase-like protein